MTTIERHRFFGEDALTGKVHHEIGTSEDDVSTVA